MKRRVLFRVALAAVALYGCASVLGIDDIPVPDATDGGIADGTTVTDAPAETRTTDATILDGDTGADADIDAGPSFFVIQPGGKFDPSAVFWDAPSHVLYIADNAGSTGAEIATWTDVGDASDAGVVTFAPVKNLLAGERFGQMVYLPSFHKVIVTAHTATKGDIYNVFAGNAQGQSSSVAVYGVAYDGDQEMYVTEARLDGGEVGSFAAAQTSTVIGPFVPLPERALGLVAHQDAIIVALADGTLIQYSTTDPGSERPLANIDRDGGYMIDGPDGSLLVGADSVILSINPTPASVVVPIASPEGKPFQNLGAFTYDSQTKRLFVPEGAGADGGAGRILVFPLPAQ